jgi:hypothetical protein
MCLSDHSFIYQPCGLASLLQGVAAGKWSSRSKRCRQRPLRLAPVLTGCWLSSSHLYTSTMAPDLPSEDGSNSCAVTRDARPTNCFVAVHAGAGYHSRKKEKQYTAALREACVRAVESARNGMDIIDCVVAAIKTLEVSMHAACTTHAVIPAQTSLLV